MTFEEYWWIGICANPNMARDTLLKQIAESAWNAGAKAEREECANVCDALSEEAWKRYKKMYYPHDEGLSDGAAACANDIRARSNTKLTGLAPGKDEQ